MKRNLLAASLLVALSPFASAQMAQGTFFTYQGNLTASGHPASGTFDMTFALYESARRPSWARPRWAHRSR